MWAIKVLSGCLLIAYSTWAVVTDEELLRNGKILIAAQSLILAGGVTHLMHYAVLKSRSRNLSKPNQLVTSSLLFRWVRHPMYLGDIVLSSGFCLLVRDVVTLVLVSLIFLAIHFQAHIEDQEMEAMFGDSFRSWKSGTGSLFPFF